MNSRYLISRKEHLARDWNVKSGKDLDGTLTSILPSTPALAGGETSDPLVHQARQSPATSGENKAIVRITAEYTEPNTLCPES